MKKLISLMLVLAAVFICGCGTHGTGETVLPETEAEYVYVQAITDEGIYGSDTFIYYENADEEFKLLDTVRVEFYPEYSQKENGKINFSEGENSVEYEYCRVISKTVSVRRADYQAGEPVYDKPVIYLYPPTVTEVSVKVNFKGRFTQTIPEYNGIWRVTAHPDGTIYTADNKEYPYLFWEGVPENAVSQDSGFCIRGEDTLAFLNEALSQLGLNDNEKSEFIDFWLPRMINNPYNTVQFHYEDYSEEAPLEISPAPDSVLRVFMSFKAQSEFVEIPTQELRPFVRKGFCVVEWGGAELK